MIKFDFNNMTVDAIGTQEGIDISKSVAINKTNIDRAFNRVIDNIGKGWQEWCLLPDTNTLDIKEIQDFCDDIKSRAKDWVVLGVGGSALGPLAVANALMHQKHNFLKDVDRKTPRLFVEDNIDPMRMQSLIDCIDIDNAYFNVITKSGETSETLSQFMVLYEIVVKRLGADKAKTRFIITTTIGKGAAYDTAIQLGLRVFGVGKGVGGRFSVLSAVGLLTFGIMGIDIKELLSGAKIMSDKAKQKDIFKNPALLSAYLQVESMRKGKNISVLMPYSDALRYMADFYCQLWGESLGKAVDNDGKVVNVGQTPVKSLGVTDQHSQVQLYTEGPYDKVVTILAVDDFGFDITIPKHTFKAGDFLGGCTMGKLLNAERIATEFALTKAKRANFTIYFDKINASNVGQLLSYYMYQTAFAGAMLNIDTFNQPGVEEGKLATFAMIGRAGYEDKLKEIKSQPKDNKYII